MKHLPNWANPPLRSAQVIIRSLAYSGQGRHCPVCGFEAWQFLQAGNPPRPDAQCPHCGALERHRLAWWYFVHFTSLFNESPKRVLHVAPEACFEPRLRRLLGDDYTTADLYKVADVKMDITDIQYKDGWFHVIYCSHVLEHVTDDRQAMGEFYRVLHPGGWAILLVPINHELHLTFEDRAALDPRERLRLFGQVDHARRYGTDYPDRLRAAGFEVAVIRVGDLVSTDEAVLMGLTAHAGEIYLCGKGHGKEG